MAAIVTARASLVASDATSDWNKSVAREQKRGALLLEGIRYTYGTEGDQAFMLATATLKAQALREAAAGAPARSPDSTPLGPGFGWARMDRP